MNEEDDTKLPEGFIYINSNCVTVDEIQIDRKITSMHSCNCEYKCSTFDCVCCDNSLKCWYNEEGRLLDNFNYFGKFIDYVIYKKCYFIYFLKILL